MANEKKIEKQNMDYVVEKDKDGLPVIRMTPTDKGFVELLMNDLRLLLPFTLDQKRALVLEANRMNAELKAIKAENKAAKKALKDAAKQAKEAGKDKE